MTYPTDRTAEEGPRMGSAKARDQQHEDYLITRALRTSGGWVVTLDTGISVAVPAKDGGPEPVLGAVARCYGLGPGFRVRGMDIDGVELYYRTEQEEAERHRQAIEEFNRQ